MGKTPKKHRKSTEERREEVVQKFMSELREERVTRPQVPIAPLRDLPLEEPEDDLPKQPNLRRSWPGRSGRG